MNPLIRPFLLLAALSVFPIAGGAFAAETGLEDVILFANGDQLHGHLEGLDADRITWRSGQADAPIRFAAAGVSKLELPRAKGAPSALRVVLTTGESLPCDAVSLDDAKVELETGYGGKITAARKLVSRIEFTAAANADKKKTARSDSDCLVTRNGDSVSGHLLGISGGKAKLRSEVAGEVEIPMDHLGEISLHAPAPTPQDANPAKGGIHVRLVGGGLLSFNLDRLEAGVLHGHSPHIGDIHLKLDAVEAIGVADADPRGWKTTASGLRYRIIKDGGREHPGARDTVKVNYELHLKDGAQVDASAKHGGPIEFPLDGVVKGFSEGTKLIGKGGKIELIVPPELGYGDIARPELPASSTLYFTIDLVDFKGNADANGVQGGGND